MSERTENKEAAVQLRRTEVVRLRLLGYSYGDIVATGLYKSRSGARDAYMAALKENYQEPTEAARLMEVARIEALIMANWNDAINGTILVRAEAGRLVLKLIDRKCKVLGIDAPAKIDIVSMLTNLATAAGVNPEDALREADGLLNQYQVQGNA